LENIIHVLNISQQPDGLALLVDKSQKKTAARKRSKAMVNNLVFYYHLALVIIFLL